MTQEKLRKAKFVVHEEKVVNLKKEEPLYKKSLIPQLQVDILPSTWLPYPSGGSITYHPYVFGEIKQFNQSKFRGKARLEFIMQGIETSFPKEDLTLADMLYIGLMRKISTLGETQTKITYICAHCGESNEFILLNSDLAFDDILAKKLPVIASLSDGDYHFTPLTMKSYMELLDQGLHNETIPTYAKMCINRPYEKAYERFYAANSEDGAILEAVDELLYHGITPMEKICSKCGGLTQVEVEGGEILISPFCEYSEFITGRIRFGV